MIMIPLLTDRARKAMILANQEACRFNHEYVGTEHLLLGLVKEGGGIGANVLANLGIDLRKVRLEVEKIVKRGPETVVMGKLSRTPRAKRVADYAIAETRTLEHNYVGTEHLLLGLLREQDGVAAQVLTRLGAKLEDVRKAVLEVIQREEVTQRENPVGKAAREFFDELHEAVAVGQLAIETPEQQPSVTIQVSIDIAYETINDLIVSAVEGGINYWAPKIQLFELPTTGKFGLWRNHPTTFAKMPAFPNGVITLIDNDGKEHVLNCAAAYLGLTKMTKIAPRHFANIVKECWDAETADVFIQCWLFGEIVYG